MRLLIVDARVTGRDRTALAGLIERAEVDLACVHRAPNQLRWRSICAALGRRSGLVTAAGGRPAGANLLLSTLGIDALHALDLPLGRGPFEPAGAALAALRVGGVSGAQFVFCGARLAGRAASRVEQAHALQGALERFVPGRPPVLLAVDGLDDAGDAAADVLRLGRRELGSGLFVGESVVAGEPATLPIVTPGAVPAPTTVELTVG